MHRPLLSTSLQEAAAIWRVNRVGTSGTGLVLPRGVEYGYSHPISRRLNLDFTIGIGYLGGTYHEYLPIDDCYVWQFTKKQNWIGPTKAEVSLVWLLGSDNYNKEKGGKR